MRSFRTTAIATVTVLLGSGLAACGNSGGEVAQDDMSPVSVMRQAAAQSGGASFTFVMEATQGKETFTGRGEYRGGEPSALHQVMEMPGGLGSSEILMIGKRTWTKFGGGDAGLGAFFPTDKWVSFPEGEDEFGSSAEDLDFRTFLQALFAAADVREIGAEEVDGAATRHYSGTVTAAGVRASPDIDPEVKKSLAEELAAAEGDKAQIEAWVDRDFQVRKFAQTGSDEDGEYRMTMTLSDIGQPVDIAEPAKSEVVDEKSLFKNMNSRAKDAKRKAIAKYGSEAELKKACRKLEKEFAGSFDGGASSDSPPDQSLLLACSAVMMPDEPF